MADYSVDVKVKLDVQDIQNAVNAKPITATIIPKITFNNNIDGNDLKSVKDAVQRYFQEDANRVGLRFKENESFLQKDLDRIQSAINKVSSINIKTKLDVDDFQKFRQDIEIIKDSLSGLTSKTITLRFASPDKVELDGIIKSIEEHFRSTPINLTFSRPENNPNSLNLAIGFNQDHLSQFQTALDAIEQIVKDFPSIQVGIDFQKEQYLAFIDGMNALEEMDKKFPALEINITTNTTNLELFKNQIEEYFRNNPVNLNFQATPASQESTASVQNTFNQLNQDIQNTFNQLNQTLQNITNNVQNITNNIDNSVNNTTRNVQNNTLEIDNSINNTTRNVQNNTLRIGDAIRNTLDQSNRQYNTFDNSINVRFNQTTRYIQNNIQRINDDVEHANNHANNLLNTLMQYFGITRIIGAVQNSFQKMVQEVRDLDVELTEFSKVTDLSAEQTQKFIDKCYDLGDTVARTGTEVVQATTLFKKMGYTIDESMNFAQDALMWTNVADGMVTVENSTNMLISTMKAFEEQGLSSTHVIDALNEVSNNYSTSSSALSDNLSTVAATLAVSGTSFEQTVGLMTAGIEIMPEKASKVANGLKTISQRIRQIDGDTADKLDEFLGEQGISRFDEVTGELKGTYQILEEISGVWDNLTVNQRQYIGEVMAGKNQITVLNALMMNFKTAINATETAMNSSGSAARENARVLDSIQGHIQRFQSAFEELSKNLINSEVFKQVVDFGTNLIKILISLTDESWKLITIFGGTGIATIVNVIQRFNNGFNQAQQAVTNFNNALEEAQQQGRRLDETFQNFQTRGQYFSGIISNAQIATAAIGILITAYTTFYQIAQEADRRREQEYQDDISNRNEEINKIQQLKKLEEEYLDTTDIEKKKEVYEKIYDIRKEIYQIDNDGLSTTKLLSGEIEKQNQLYDQQLVNLSLINLEKKKQHQWTEEHEHSAGPFSHLPGSDKNASIEGDISALYGNDYLNGMGYQEFMDNINISIQNKIDNLKTLQAHIAELMRGVNPDTEVYKNLSNMYDLVSDDLKTLGKQNEDILSETQTTAKTVLGDLSTYTDEELGAMAQLFDAISTGSLEDMSKALVELQDVFGEDLEDNFIQEITENLSDPDVAQAAYDLITKFQDLQKAASSASEELSYNYSDAMGELLSIVVETTTSIQQQYDTLTQAVDEFAESGVITKETLQSLTENDLLQYLEMVDGELSLNEEAFYRDAEATLTKASADIDAKVEADLLKLANEKLKESLDNLPSSTSDASTGITDVTNAATNATIELLNDAGAAAETAASLEKLGNVIGKTINETNFDLQGYLTDAQKIIDQANQLKNSLGKYTPSVSRGSSSSRSSGSGGSSSSKSSSGSSSSDREAEKAQREAEQAAKDAQKAWKDSFEIEYKKLKTYLDAELITHEEYYDALEELNKHFFEGRAEFEEEYWKYQDEIIKGRKKYLEDELEDYFSKGEKILKHQLNVEYITEEEYYDALTLLYETYYTDKEKYEEEYWKLEEDIYKLRKKQIKELEDELSDLYKEIEDLHKNYIKSLEEDNKELETVIGYAVDVLDEEIEKLKAEKTALSEANEALEEQIKLQELEDALEKAKQKKIRVYRKGQGFVYEQDTKAVGEAQSAIDEYKKELAHKKQLSMIDEEIAKLEEYKKAWKDITENYKRSQNEMTAAGVLGENAREKILAREYNAVGLVGTQYESVRARMEAANNATIEDLEDYIGDEATAGTFSYEIKRIKDKINEIQNKTVTLQVNTSNSVSNIQNVIDSINSLKNKLEQGYSTNNLNNWLTSWKNTINAAYQYSQQYGITPSTGGGSSGSGSGSGSGGSTIGDVSIGTSVPATNEIVNAIIADAENGQSSSNASYILGYLQQGFKVKGISSSGKAQIGPVNTNDQDIWWVLDQVYFSNGSSGGSSGGDDSGSSSGGEYSEPVYGSNGQIIGYNHYSGDGTLLWYEAAHAKGTLGTTTKTFLVNEEGMEAMVTPEGTVISAPSTGYGVIKNEYTERLTDFAADPMNFLNKTFSGYTGTYQNNPSTNEVININGNLNLPNVTDGQSFVDSIRNVALQYTTRRR